MASKQPADLSPIAFGHPRIDLRVAALHVPLRRGERGEPVTGIQAMRIGCGKHPKPQILQLRMGYYGCHHGLADAGAAMRGIDEYIGDVGESRAVGDHACEADRCFIAPLDQTPPAASDPPNGSCAQASRERGQVVSDKGPW